MTYRDLARYTVSRALRLVVDDQISLHPAGAVETVEDALTDALRATLNREREACARIAESFRGQRNATARAASSIRSRKLTEIPE